MKTFKRTVSFYENDPENMHTLEKGKWYLVIVFGVDFIEKVSPATWDGKDFIFKAPYSCLANETPSIKDKYILGWSPFIDYGRLEFV